MAKQAIDIGTTANDGTGTTLRDGGDLINDNFNEIYSKLIVLEQFFLRIYGHTFQRIDSYNTLIIIFYCYVQNKKLCSSVPINLQCRFINYIFINT